MKSKSSAFVLFLLMSVSWISNSEVVGSGLDKGSFTDTRDGQTYKWVKIGDLMWMAENLRYLPSVNDPADASETIPLYYVYGYFGTDVSAATTTDNYKNYGVLYNYPAALNACPPGWHLPDVGDWTALQAHLVSHGYHNEDAVDGAGNALKSCRQIDSPQEGDCDTSEHPRWYAHDIHYGTDVFGFSALPGGFRWTNERFILLGMEGSWWSATGSSAVNALTRGIRYNYGYIIHYEDPKICGFSVRCVKD